MLVDEKYICYTVCTDPRYADYQSKQLLNEVQRSFKNQGVDVLRSAPAGSYTASMKSEIEAIVNEYEVKTDSLTQATNSVRDATAVAHESIEVAMRNFE